MYRAWRSVQPEQSPVPDESEPRAFEEAEEAAWAEIRTHLAELPPYEFQDLFAALLRAMSYHVLWVAPPGPDRGIDMIAHTDPIGMTSPRIKVQVKRQPETKIAVEGLRAFLAVLGESSGAGSVLAEGWVSFS